MADRSGLPDPSNRSAIQSMDRLEKGEGKKNGGGSQKFDMQQRDEEKFQIHELGVREDELGSYLFDYFEQIDNRFKDSFCSSNMAIRSAIAGFLTYHYFKLVRVDSKQKAGLFCFGCKNPRKIHVVHISVLHIEDFPQALSDIKTIIWREFPLATSITLLVKYPRASPSEFNGLKEEYRPMDCLFMEQLRLSAFKRTFIQVDAGGHNRISGFTIYRNGYKAIMDPLSLRLVLPRLEHDSKAVNINVKLTMVVANHPITPDRKQPQKEVVQTEFGPGIPLDYLVDLRGPVTLLLAHYATLYSKSSKAVFNLPGLRVASQDLLSCKQKLGSLKVDSLQKNDRRLFHEQLVSLRDSQMRLKGLGLPLEINAKGAAADTGKLKSYLSVTDLDLAIKYSEFGRIPVRYAGEERESAKDYIRIRAVGFHNQNQEMFRLVSKRTQSTIYIMHTDDPDVSFFAVGDYKLFKEMNKNQLHLSQIVQELFSVVSNK